MENIKSTENNAVKAAMEALNGGGNAAQSAMSEAIIRAKFLMPVLDPFNGKHNIPDDELPPCTIKNQEGKLFIPLFTDWGELTRNSQIAAQLSKHVILADISDCYGYLVSRDKLEGATINPFGKSLALPRGLVENLAKYWSKVKTAELSGEKIATANAPQQVRLSVPKEYPDCVRPFLISAMKRISDVSRAWMCTVQKDGDKDYTWLVIVESELGVKGREELFRTSAQNLLPCLDGRGIGFTAVSPQFKGIVDNAQPVYVRGMDEAEEKNV